MHIQIHNGFDIQMVRRRDARSDSPCLHRGHAGSAVASMRALERSPSTCNPRLRPGDSSSRPRELWGAHLSRSATTKRTSPRSTLTVPVNLERGAAILVLHTTGRARIPSPKRACSFIPCTSKSTTASTASFGVRRGINRLTLRGYLVYAQRASCYFSTQGHALRGRCRCASVFKLLSVTSTRALERSPSTCNSRLRPGDSSQRSRGLPANSGALSVTVVDLQFLRSPALSTPSLECPPIAVVDLQNSRPPRPTCRSAAPIQDAVCASHTTVTRTSIYRTRARLPSPKRACSSIPCKSKTQTSSTTRFGGREVCIWFVTSG
ncbi:hypothetical protein EXIGLDRAFT_478726 [Exidia glandulosa HHB12029]|uniref:Uncharacterized protein n=1 Tax=Exidia glandulosa HHB12029 TaxID=1314781 RepID=A0A166NHY0_EXIGL|nr:hypothetical protein EXIGLDRAFT_478726 [Exidia glandulosa HHB12029]